MYAMPPAQPLSVGTPVGSYPVSQTAPTVQPQPAQQVAPTIVQRTTIEHVPARSDMLVGTDHWTWLELRDYVCGEIISRFGPFPRFSQKEYGIFNRFFNEYGAKGIEVAKYAFEICDGMWGSAPVSINRFCKNSDPYFVQPILERLADVRG